MGHYGRPRNSNHLPTPVYNMFCVCNPEGSDYTQGPYSVTFGTEAGDRQCINIPVVTDDMNEGSEEFSVVLAASPASNLMVLPGDQAMATVNIIGTNSFWLCLN